MGLLWPGLLLLLGLIPLIVGLYIWMLQRRRRFAVRYSSLSLVREALPHQSWLRRHLPFVLFTLALASLIVAFSRPVAVVQVPAGQATVILAMDVSRSMCMTDIQPSRLEAAKDAAVSFLQRQPATTQVGIVAFAGFGELVQPPVSDQEVLQSAVESLTTGRRTAIGSGIVESLDAIAEIDDNVAPSDEQVLPETGSTADEAYAPAIIVLLTDGVSNAGPHPLEAAQLAVDRGIRVYTIGFGTENENQSIPDCGRQFWGGGSFGGGQFFGGGSFGGRFRRGIDELTLKEIAAMTGGEYYSASSASELNRVFQELPTSLVTRAENMEISVAFTAVGALLALLAVALALIWHPLP